jgi:hypothetical protein
MEVAKIIRSISKLTGLNKTLKQLPDLLKNLNQREIQLIEWENNKISDLDLNVVYETLPQTVAVILELYGNRTVNNPINEAVIRSIITDFSFLAIEELPEAFRLWSQRKFEGSEPYGGEFNLHNINLILTDYCKYRKTERGNLFDKIKTEKENMAKEEDKYKNMREFNENIKQIIMELVNKARSHKDIQSWIYKRAEKEGLFDLTIEEMNEILERAIELTKADLRAEIEVCRYTDKNRVKDLQHILDDQVKLKDHAKITAGKIAVWEVLKLGQI